MAKHVSSTVETMEKPESSEIVVVEVTKPLSEMDVIREEYKRKMKEARKRMKEKAGEEAERALSAEITELATGIEHAVGIFFERSKPYRVSAIRLTPEGVKVSVTKRPMTV